MSNSEYKISIKGTELSFEQNVTLELAKRLVAIAASGGAAEQPSHKNDANNAGTNSGGPAATPTSDGLSLAEYLTAHEAKRNIDQITTIGEYLKLYRNKNTFTQGDIEAAFEEAGEVVPANISRDLTWAKKAGWIAPKAGLDGSFYVTTSGKAAVSDKFSADTKKKSKASAGGRKKKKKEPAKP
jgi:hypothetical protein